MKTEAVQVICRVRGAANAQAVFDTMAQARLMGETPTGVRWREPTDKRKSHVLAFQYFGPDKAQSMLHALYPRAKRCITCTQG